MVFQMYMSKNCCNAMEHVQKHSINIGNVKQKKNTIVKKNIVIQWCMS